MVRTDACRRAQKVEEALEVPGVVRRRFAADVRELGRRATKQLDAQIEALETALDVVRAPRSAAHALLELQQLAQIAGDLERRRVVQAPIAQQAYYSASLAADGRIRARSR
jgi:hypothetical protein